LKVLFFQSIVVFILCYSECIADFRLLRLCVSFNCILFCFNVAYGSG